MPVYQSNVFTLMSNISVPSQESELTNFMVKQEGESCFFTLSQCHSVSLFFAMMLNCHSVGGKRPVCTVN